MKTEIEVVLVSITHDSGHTSRMQFVVRAPLRSFSPEAAALHGFVVDGEYWVRRPVQELVQAEVDRTNFAPEAPLKGEMKKVGKVVSWSMK